jgi:phosphocarrier protein HPr
MSIVVTPGAQASAGAGQGAMAHETTQSVQVTIRNPMGFHIRPAQRFAELAQVFEADVQVQVRGRMVPGKSIVNLMALGGQFGETMTITASGPDARQCLGVLKFLAESKFFVEDDLAPGEQPERHLERLSCMAACFDSSVTATVDGRNVDAKSFAALRELRLGPGSRPALSIAGGDAGQARAALANLIGHCFYVEDEILREGREGA